MTQNQKLFHPWPAWTTSRLRVVCLLKWMRKPPTGTRTTTRWDIGSLQGNFELNERLRCCFSVDRHKRGVDVHVVQRRPQKSRKRKHSEKNPHWSRSHHRTGWCGWFLGPANHRVCPISRGNSDAFHHWGTFYFKENSATFSRFVLKLVDFFRWPFLCDSYFFCWVLLSQIWITTR